MLLKKTAKQLEKEKNGIYKCNDQRWEKDKKMFFKFCRQGGNPKIPKKFHFQWLIWEMIDCLEVFARPFQVIQTVQRDIYYWKLCWYKIPLFFTNNIVLIKKKWPSSMDLTQNNKKSTTFVHQIWCAFLVNMLIITGKKLIWLLVSVGKSKIWPYTGSFLQRN